MFSVRFYHTKITKRIDVKFDAKNGDILICSWKPYNSFVVFIKDKNGVMRTRDIKVKNKALKDGLSKALEKLKEWKILTKSEKQVIEKRLEKQIVEIEKRLLIEEI